MRLDELHKIYIDCRTNKNYRLWDESDETFLAQAKASFDRLPIKQQNEVANSWSKYFDRHKEDKEGDFNPFKLFATDKEAIDALKLYRFLAQTNLFFLCKLLEKYSQVEKDTHEEICNKFFVRKDPKYPTFEQFAIQYDNDQHDLKRRLLLTPRGGFKSSLNMADCVQYIICWPAVTILVLTGVYKLASDFVGEIREHFTLEESTNELDPKGKPLAVPRSLMDKTTGAWSESLFQVIFPEHCVRPGEGNQFEFQTPAVAQSDGREPTVRAASIEQALSGMHFGVLKLDDVVTNENSLTVTRLEAVNKQISINRAMLHPFGFFDVIGTWYDEKDFYGLTIKMEEKFSAEQGKPIVGSVDSGRFESSVNFKVYLRAAWWPEEEAIKQGKIEEEMVETDWKLWFPQRLPYKFLLLEKTTDPDGFPIKYLNNPRKLHQVKFPRELLMRRTIPHSQLPAQGMVVMTVDTAYSTKSWADYTVIITSLIFGGRFYIVNMVRGRFNEYDLPKVIASTAYKWKPKRICIEDSVGVKWMGQELRREMTLLKISIPVEFVPLGEGSKANSKSMKSKPVLRLLGDERMYFLNSCEGLQELYTELEKFTGTSDDAHDDIVSALSLLADQFGAYADMDARVNYADTQFNANRLDQELHDRIYGLGRYARFNAGNMIDDNPVTQFQLEQQPSVDEEIDPLQGLF